MAFSGQWKIDTEMMDKLLCIGTSFDIIRRDFCVADRSATLYFIDGFAKDEVLEMVMEFLISAEPKKIKKAKTAKELADGLVPYIESAVVTEEKKAVSDVLSGALIVLLDGFAEAIQIDARTYPTRSAEEPEDDKVLRGSHDGFVETLIFNTALIRRRIRDPALTMEMYSVGSISKTDVVLCYSKDKVDPDVLKQIREKMKGLKIKALTMGQESLAEVLIESKWYNPFPKVRYTERPDAAAASVLEGSIVLITDTSPSAMVIPCSIFDFFQETNDYYFPPFTATYIKLARIFIFFATIFVTPVWLLLLKNPNWIPEWLSFIQVKEPNSVPIVFQLLLLELAIDVLRLATLNTPSSLGNSLSIIGGLILGDFAVQARWFVPEAILYMAFVAIANFTQPSYELGYAFKFMRMEILVLTAVLGVWGFAAGVLMMMLCLATNKTIIGKSYLYPLIPFNGRVLSRLVFVRKRLKE